MCDISPSVLEALSTLVAPEILNFVCLVEYAGQQWYLSLGRSSFFFIATELERKIEPAIPYSKIAVLRVPK